jgi:hypothetical protein
MADYYTPTVVEQTIPNCDMTPLERLILTNILDWEPDDDGVYFFTETGPCDCIEVNTNDFRTAFEQSRDVKSFTTDYLADAFAKLDSTKNYVDIDFSGTSWEFIFQDIIRRSSTLKFVVILAAFTCSKMRPDGFGGMAQLITADDIKGKSTYDILREFFEESEPIAAGEQSA